MQYVYTIGPCSVVAYENIICIVSVHVCQYYYCTLYMHMCICDGKWRNDVIYMYIHVFTNVLYCIMMFRGYMTRNPYYEGWALGILWHYTLISPQE